MIFHEKRQLAILGSTGSIGTQTLEVVEHNGDIQVEALSANGNVELLEKQARSFIRLSSLSSVRLQQKT